jgi:hypothetical protein
VERIDERMNESQPTTVVLVCGENDLWDDSPSVVFSNFKKIVSKISAKGASVIYLGTKPEPFTKYIHAEYRQYDAMIRDHYGQNQQEPLVMIDVYPSFVELGNPNSLYANDKLHLSQQGYEFWNSWLKAALNDTSGCLRWESGKCTLTSNTDDNNNDNDTQPTSAPTLTSNADNNDSDNNSQATSTPSLTSNNNDNDTQPTSAPTLTSNSDDGTPSSTSASLRAYRFSCCVIFFCSFTGQFYFFSF